MTGVPTSLLDWLTDSKEAVPGWGYQTGEPPAAEPTAVAILALLAGGRLQAAIDALQWLCEFQATDGSLGVRAGEPTPKWPTSLAVLAWQSALVAGRQGKLLLPGASQVADPPAFPAAQVRLGDEGLEAELQQAKDRAVAWLLQAVGKPLPPMHPPGHDTSIVAWPWVAQTHSWVEPTAFSVLALKSVGLADHPRVREGVRLLLDRQLPGGGCNYGNTFVLGARLRPHVLPTALSILALAEERDAAGAWDPRVQASIRWLKGAVQTDSGALSLSWSFVALHAVQQLPSDAPARWEAALQRVWRQDRAPFKLAMLALAQQQLDIPSIAPAT